MFCVNCKQKRCIKFGVPCRKVEKILPKERTGSFSGEKSHNPYHLEDVANYRAIRLKYGIRKLFFVDDEENVYGANLSTN
jgi:hypothetical protein